MKKKTSYKKSREGNFLMPLYIYIYLLLVGCGIIGLGVGSNSSDSGDIAESSPIGRFGAKSPDSWFSVLPSPSTEFSSSWFFRGRP